jgi:predicted HicB family RNase H-like nuclease
MSRAAQKSAAGSRKRPARQPTSGQRARAKRPKEPVKSPEPVSQVTIKMRESLHRELARKAFNSGMTMRGYIMRALKQAGLGVTEADLVDGRKSGRVQSSNR